VTHKGLNIISFTTPSPSRYKTKAQEAQKRGKALTETALAAAASSYGLA